MKRMLWSSVLVVCAQMASGALLLEARLDGFSWSGVPGEVVDHGTLGLDGQAVAGARTVGSTPALPGSPGTCRYGEFDGVDDHLVFPDDPGLDIEDNLTVTAWIYARSYSPGGVTSFLTKDTNYEMHLKDTGVVNWWWNTSTGTVRQLDSTGVVRLGSWHHVAMTYTSGEQIVYIDGVPAGGAAFTGTLATNDVDLQIGQDQGIEDRFWDGMIDEVRVYDQVLSPAEVQVVMNDTRPCPIDPALLEGEWRFDEINWTGAPDEVIDSSGNGRHGNATLAATEPGLLCGAADLGAPGTGDYLTLGDAAIDGLSDGSIVMWVRTSRNDTQAFLSGAHSGQANELMFWWQNGIRTQPYVKGSNATIDTGGIADGQWHQLAWTRSGASNCIYVDGALQGCRDLPTGALRIDPGGFVVGQEQDSVGGGFDASQAVQGDVDELLVFSTVLSEADIQSIRANHLGGLGWDGADRACPVFPPTHFVIDHDAGGVRCLGESISVAAVNGAGAVVDTYGNQVTLDTQSGRGTWRLVAGGGFFADVTPDDGLAVYQFAAGDQGVAVFALDYGDGASPIDVDVYQTDDLTLRDDDSEGLLAFASTGFTVTAHALPTPAPNPVVDPVGPEIAAADFAVHLTAYGSTPTDPVCGVVEAYTGPRPVKFWMDHLNPVAGPRVATVDGVAVASSGAGAVNRTVNFSQGRAVVAASYRDVGAINLAMRDDTSFADPMDGATGGFVVKPAELVIYQVVSVAGIFNPAADSLTGPGFVAAGEPFLVRIEARDALDQPTPSFGQEIVPESVRVISHSVELPVGGRNGSTGDLIGGDRFNFTGIPGRLESEPVTWDEFGVIQLRPELLDGDYLGAGPVAPRLSGAVGRFHPASFAVTGAAVTPACGTYTYMSQPALGISYTLEARNQAGKVLQNYDTALAGGTGLVSPAYVAEANDDGVDLGFRLSPLPATWVGGIVNVSDPTASFARGPLPEAPLDPLQLGLEITDTLDLVKLADLNMAPSAAGDCAGAASCTARTLGAPIRMVYGRMMVMPGFGPETQNLDVPLQAQLYDGSLFRTHAADGCSAYSAGLAALDQHAGSLSVGDTALLAPAPLTALVGGRADPGAPLMLSAPGLGRDGSVRLTLDVPGWLEFNWLGAGDIDPSGVQTFGRYRGHDRIIYWREL